MRSVLAVAGLAALAYALVCAAFFVAQRAFIYFPVPGRDAAVPAFALERGGVDVLVSTHAADAPRAVVYFGGNAEDVSRAVPALRAAFDGAAVYALHYRGYGGSAGRPSEPVLVADATALLAHAAARHRELIVVGRSLGSGVAVQAARRHPPARLVLVTPFDSLAAVARRHYPWLPVDALLRDRYDSAAHAAHLAVPVDLIAAAEDIVVPPAHARALATAFPPGRARLRLLAGVGHNDIEAHPEFASALAGDGPAAR